MKPGNAIFLLLISLFPFSCNREMNPGSFPNVIYISVEDMKPDLGCYGDTLAITPRIDAFAEDAVLFRDAHCQVPLCTPSRTSILTGIRPSTSGIVKIDDAWQEILPGAVSLPRHLKDHGYHTIQAGKIYDYRCGGMDSAFHRVFDIHGLPSNDLAMKAIRYADARDEPWFLAIGYGLVHLPWNPTEGSRAKFRPGQMDIRNRDRDFKGRRLSETDTRELIMDYYASITDTDSLIGQVLDTLIARGMYDRSIILIGAMDHGFSLGYHGHWGKGNNYDGETMVPLLVRVPGNPGNGKATSGIVELVDLYPTLIDLCGLPPPPQELEGVSFAGLLMEPERRWKKAAFTHRAYHVNDRGIKTASHTLILREGEPAQLFDRKQDPHNLVNLAPQNPDLVRELGTMLEKGWRSALPDE